MSLRSLWNSICGRTPSPQATVAPAPVAHGSTTTAPVSRVGKTPAVPDKSTAPIASPRVAASRDDRKLFQRLESLSVQSILEIGIGDGMRAAAMLQTLTHKGHSTPIHYIAIDEFEMGGKQLSLREFHKQLREFPAKVHLVPMPIDLGLDRVIRTYGQIDCVIWATDQLPSAKQQDTLARISKPTTVLFSREGATWSESSLTAWKSKHAA